MLYNIRLKQQSFQQREWKIRDSRSLSPASYTITPNKNYDDKERTKPGGC